MMLPADCDQVGGVCYEKIPEGEVLLWIAAVILVAHLLFVVIPIWWQEKGRKVKR